MRLAFFALLAGLAPALPASDSLPDYVRQEPVSGVIRNYGNGWAGMLRKWEAGFQRYHPDVRFEDTLPTSDAAFPGA